MNPNDSYVEAANNQLIYDAKQALQQLTHVAKLNRLYSGARASQIIWEQKAFKDIDFTDKL